MLTINDVTEADGSALPDDCRESRLRLVRSHTTPDDVAFRFYSDEFTHPHFPEVESAAVAHVRGCSRCRQWIVRVLPADALARAERMSHYCCSRMFHACKGEDDRVPRMAFR